MATSSPSQHDEMAGRVYGDHSYSSQHHDDGAPTYVVHFQAVAAHKDAHGHMVKAQPAHDQTFTGEQAKAAFKAKYGYVYED